MGSLTVISADGSKIYAEASGEPTKPSIVFIHGFSLTGAVFDNIFANKEFNASFYLVRYDLRGHGRSDKPDDAEGYDSKKFAEDFASVKAAFRLDKPIIVGWSYGATILADITSYLEEGTVSGAVYLSALPYVGPILPRVATPEIQNIMPGLQEENDVILALKSLLKFSDLLFMDPSTIPWEMKWKWGGMAAVQSPRHRRFLLSRQQDPTKLLELGQDGFPLLIIHGKYDKQVDGEVVIREMKPLFKNVDVCLIEEGGSHAVHIENERAVLGSIQSFAKKIFVQ